MENIHNQLNFFKQRSIHSILVYSFTYFGLKTGNIQRSIINGRPLEFSLLWSQLFSHEEIIQTQPFFWPGSGEGGSGVEFGKNEILESQKTKKEIKYVISYHFENL